MPYDLPPIKDAVLEKLAKPPSAYDQVYNTEQLRALRGSPLELMIAQNGKASPPTSSIDYSRYRTVDDILAGSPFIRVDARNLKQETSGDSVLFFYDNKYPDKADGRLAILLKEAANRYPNVRFLKYQFSGNEDWSLGFQATPHLKIFKNGMEVVSVPRGPKADNIEDWRQWLDKKLRDNFGQ